MQKSKEEFCESGREPDGAFSGEFDQKFDQKFDQEFDQEFDREFDRKSTHDLKWRRAGVEAYLSQPIRDDMIPMWIADTDFGCMKGIVEAVKRRAEHEITATVRREAILQRGRLLGENAVWLGHPVWLGDSSSIGGQRHQHCRTRLFGGRERNHCPDSRIRSVHQHCETDRTGSGV